MFGIKCEDPRKRRPKLFCQKNITSQREKTKQTIKNQDCLDDPSGIALLPTIKILKQKTETEIKKIEQTINELEKNIQHLKQNTKSSVHANFADKNIKKIRIFIEKIKEINSTTNDNTNKTDDINSTESIS